MSVVHTSNVLFHMPLVFNASVMLWMLSSTTDTMALNVSCLTSPVLYRSMKRWGASIGACVLCRAKYMNSGTLSPRNARWFWIVVTAFLVKM